MISATMFKVSNRMRQIVRARDEADLSEEQKGLLDETLVRERQTMRDLFNAIIEAVMTIANAAQDDMIERFDGDSAEQTLLQQWGARWARVWRRKMAVEEAIVSEAAIEAADIAREAERVKAEAQAVEAAATAAAVAEQAVDANMDQEDHDIA
jgi:nuclear cap-binding protein subunit 1